MYHFQKLHPKPTPFLQDFLTVFRKPYLFFCYGNEVAHGVMGLATMSLRHKPNNCA
jgi:hypothetical protein